MSCATVRFEMNTITYIYAILLMVLQVNSSCPAGSKERDAQCATYCYQVVKPLLQFADSVKSNTKQFADLQDKIKELAAIISSLNDRIELSESYKSLSQQQEKLIIQNENQIKNLQAQINELQSKVEFKDRTINDLKTEFNKKQAQFARKMKQLEDKITAYQQTSSCFGKSTELHTIEVPKTKTQTFTVSCDSNLAGSGWTVIQRRMDGSVNFNRNWSEYKEGFGNLRGEFFMGLEKLHLLTRSQPHELYISLMDFKNETRYARYSDFVIGSEEEAYELKTLGSYSGDAGDSMQHHKNIKFSTPDRDHDNSHTSCAIIYGSGWWFNNCYHCNLNGQYVYQDSDKDVNSIEWRDWKKRPLKFAQMMIKPKSY